MFLVGLTGGIGSGKSTVADLLADRGAVILDADAFAREAVEPGTEALERVVERFGPSIVDAEGRLDRPRLASIVFADPERLRELEAIVHPEVRRMTAERLAERTDTDDVVVLVNPLLIQMGDHARCDLVVVVKAPPETRIARLVARGMGEADARARLATQLPADEQAAVADVVLDNEGTLDDLARRVDDLWSGLATRAKA